MVAVGLAAQFVTPAQALMIGAPQTRAELGRTLQMTIPVHLDAQESLPLSCVQAQAVFLGCFLVGSSRVDLQACKLEYSIVSPK